MLMCFLKKQSLFWARWNGFLFLWPKDSDEIVPWSQSMAALLDPAPSLLPWQQASSHSCHSLEMNRTKLITGL